MLRGMLFSQQERLVKNHTRSSDTCVFFNAEVPVDERTNSSHVGWLLVSGHEPLKHSCRYYCCVCVNSVGVIVCYLGSQHRNHTYISHFWYLWKFGWQKRFENDTNPECLQFVTPIIKKWKLSIQENPHLGLFGCSPVSSGYPFVLGAFVYHFGN